MFDFGTMALLYLISIPIIGAAVNAINAGVNTIVNRVKAAIPPKGYKTIGPSQVQEKDKRSKNNKTIIGVKNTSDTKGDGLRVIDFLSYNDRALCYWYNSSGSALQAYDFGIRGQLVYRLSGMNSMIWEWSNYGDIDINGENEIRISNNFIVSQAQAEDVGDFARKELAPHNMYQLMVYGCHPYMEIGDIYRLQIDYTLPSWNSQIELIDVDVEIRGMRMHRECGQIGATQLIVRVPSGEWTKTTSMRARKILAGLPYDALYRGTEITIGAYDYIGQATYYCDGVDDDVQIQEAIEVIAASEAGTIRLCAGSYNIGSTISILANITLEGAGSSTILKYTNTLSYACILFDAISNAGIKSLCIDGGNTDYSVINGIHVVGAYDNINISMVEVKDILHATTGYGDIYGIRAASATGSCIVTKCYVHNLSNTINGQSANAIYGVKRCDYNVVNSILSNDDLGYGISLCRKCQQNVSSNCTTANYYNSYAGSSTAYPCDDTAAGGYNS